MKKRVFSLLVCFTLMITLLPQIVLFSGAVAYGDWSYTVLEDNTAEITGYLGSATELTIPSELDGYTVTGIGYHALHNRDTLTRVTIADSVIRIREGAFLSCRALTSVSIPQNVSLIDKNAFAGCNALLEINVSADNTHYYSIDGVLFASSTGALLRCPGGKSGSFAIPNSVTSISYAAFAGCASLTGVRIPDSVQSIGSESFSDCSALTDFTISAGVTSIDRRAFYGCIGLNAVYFMGNAPSLGEHVFYQHAGDDTEVPIPELTLFYLADKSGWSAPTWNGYPTATWHLHSYTDSVTPPTCTEQGYTTHTCSCGDSYVDSYVDATGHTPVTDAAVAPTCTETGLTEGAHCSVCGEVLTAQTTVAPSGHDFQWVIDKEATASEAGTKHEQCTRCDARQNENTTIPATGGEHVHSYTDTVTAPTCTKQGYTTHTCSCGDSYVDSYVDATGHTPVTDAAVAPTCTESGLTEGAHCSVCNEVLTAQAVIAALGHTWDDGVVTKKPTTVSDGVKTYTCTRCKQTKAESIPAIDNIKLPFTDVVQRDWFYDAVVFAYSNKLFAGTSDVTFSPKNSMTRAMLVTVLWRLDAEPLPSTGNTFTDVPAGQWYTNAVIWAAEKGVVAGVGNNKFNPNGNVTREQIAAIMFRYAYMKGNNTDTRVSLSVFPDSSKVSSWAVDALSWANAEGLITGSDGKLLPQGNATRVQVAAILMRYVVNIVSGE